MPNYQLALPIIVEETLFTFVPSTILDPVGAPFFVMKPSDLLKVIHSFLHGSGLQNSLSASCVLAKQETRHFSQLSF